MARVNVRWSDDLIAAELKRLSRSYGRMPTHREMRVRGHRKLYSAMLKRGVNYWAEKLDLQRAEPWELR